MGILWGAMTWLPHCIHQSLDAPRVGCICFHFEILVIFRDINQKLMGESLKFLEILEVRNFLKTYHVTNIVDI